MHSICANYKIPRCFVQLKLLVSSAVSNLGRLTRSTPGDWLFFLHASSGQSRFPVWVSDRISGAAAAVVLSCESAAHVMMVIQSTMVYTHFKLSSTE